MRITLARIITTTNASRPSRPSRRARPAFTLLEVLLAIVIITLMMGALLAFYSYAMSIRQQLFVSIDRISAQRQIMTRLTDELRATLPGASFTGATDSLSFTTTALPIAINPGISSDRRSVSYSLLTSTDEDGNTIVNGLQRSVSDPNGPGGALPLPTDSTSANSSNPSSPTTAPADSSSASGTAPDPNAPPVPASPTDSTDLLSDGVQFIRFRYYNGTDWLDSWTDVTAPQAVEIAIGETPLPVGTDPLSYPFSLSIRVVAIPTAQAPTSQPASAGPTGDLP